MKSTRTLTIIVAAASLLATAIPASAASLPQPHPALTTKLDGKVHGKFPAAPKFKLPANAELAPRMNGTGSAAKPDAPIQKTVAPGSKHLLIDGWEGRFDQKLGSVLYYIRNYYGRTVRSFRQPTVYRDGEKYAFNCGGSRLNTVQNAWWCGSPYYVVFDTTWLTGYNNRSTGGDMAWGIILAHEFGHAAQYNLGITPANSPNVKYSIYRELFADCEAGSWAGDLQRQGRLDNIAPGDYREAVNTTLSIGDRAGTAWNAAGAHGSGTLRKAYMDYGWRYGAQACINWVRG
jgi:predicted metalloprotease